MGFFGQSSVLKLNHMPRAVIFLPSLSHQQLFSALQSHQVQGQKPSLLYLPCDRAPTIFSAADAEAPKFGREPSDLLL